MAHYQVLFSGDIAEHAQQDAVRAGLARELGIDERKARQLFSGRTVVLRSQLSQQEAQQLQSRLADLGAICRIKDLTPRQDDKAIYFRPENGPNDQTLRDITAAHIECPRCGHFQLEASHCTHCGVDIGAAMRQKHKEDLIIQKKIRELRGSEGRGSAAKAPGDSAAAAAPAAPRRQVEPRVQHFESGQHAAENDEGKGLGKVMAWFRKSS